MSPDPKGGSVCRWTEPGGARPEALSSDLEPKSMASPPILTDREEAGLETRWPRPSPAPGQVLASTLSTGKGSYMR